MLFMLIDGLILWVMNGRGWSHIFWGISLALAGGIEENHRTPLTE